MKTILWRLDYDTAIAGNQPLPILPEEWNDHFDRWYCDPPYTEFAAREMYGSTLFCNDVIWFCIYSI